MASAAKRNIGAGYVNMGAMAAIGLAVNPYLLSFLGVTTFGVWRAVQRFLDFATVADGRATQALKSVVAYRSGDDDAERNRRDVGAALTVWLIWLPVLSIVSACITLALPWLIKGVTTAEVHAVYLVGAILCANIVLSGLLWLPDSVLVGTNQGYRSMIVTTIVVSASNGFMVAAAWLGFNVVALAVIVLAANLLNGGVTLFVAHRHVPWLGIRRPRQTEVKTLFSFGGWVLVWAFVLRLFQSSELILLSALVGAAAVTNYTFTAYVLTFALQVTVMTTSGLMPQLGSHLGRGDLDRARAVVADTRQLTFAAVVIFGSGVLLFNRDFVTMWVGPHRYLGDTVNALMVASFAQLALIRSDAQIQDTGMAIRGKVLIGTAGAIASIGVAWALFARTHQVAMIYIGLISARIVMSVIFPALVRRLVPDVRRHIRANVIGIAILLASYLIGLRLHLNTLPDFAGAVVLSTAALGAATYWFLLTPETRTKVVPRRLTNKQRRQPRPPQRRPSPTLGKADSVRPFVAELQQTTGNQDV